MRRIIYTLALFSMALLSGARLAVAGDLLQLYREAEMHDPVFAAAREQYLADIEKMPQGRAGLLPQISGQWSRAKNNGSTQNPIGSFATPSTQTEWSIALTQPLFHWGNWQSYKQGELAEIAAQAQLAQAQQELIIRVSQAYFDLLAAQDNLRLAQIKQHSIQEQLAQAKRNFEIGTATIVDTHDAQARHDLAHAQEIAATSEIEVKRGALTQITGKSIDKAIAKIKNTPTLITPEPPLIDSWIQQAEKNNLQVALAQTAMETARREQSKARAGHLPSVDLLASRSYSNSQSNEAATENPATLATVGKTINNQIKLRVTVPLFAGGYTQSHLRETAALLNKAHYNLKTATRNAAQATRSAFLGVSSGLAQIKALEAAEKSALSASESNQIGYEVGVRINLDVLNAQDQLTSTRRDLYKAHYDVLMAHLNLKTAVNTLSENDLIWLDSLLAPVE